MSVNQPRGERGARGGKSLTLAIFPSNLVSALTVSEFWDAPKHAQPVTPSAVIGQLVSAHPTAPVATAGKRRMKEKKLAKTGVKKKKSCD